MNDRAKDCSVTSKHKQFSCLQDSPTENAYLAALKAHFGYWSSYDTALFVLRAAYGIDVLQESKYASKTKPPVMPAKPNTQTASEIAKQA